MSKEMKPLLSRFEEQLSGAEGAGVWNPHDEVTSPVKIYKSNLLEPDVKLVGVNTVTRETRVRAETTDDE